MPKHFLTGEELNQSELLGLIDLADDLKVQRSEGKNKASLLGKTLVLLFEKPSLRTRVSFTVAIQELGGNVVECTSATRKQEEPEDVVRVLAGYSHGVMVRTFKHSVLETMAANSPVPIINGLSDSHHPCQILADILTLKQTFGSVKGLDLAYIGDGNNVLNSILLLAPFVGINVRYACPPGFEPDAFVVKKARKRAKEGGGSIQAFSDPAAACKGANALYTDVWTSMGFEEEESSREKAFDGYQLNEKVYAAAAPNAIVLHCMPMVRGKEISEGMVNHPNALLFKQSENRLHVQKALLLGLIKTEGRA